MYSKLPAETAIFEKILCIIIYSPLSHWIGTDVLLVTLLGSIIVDYFIEVLNCDKLLMCISFIE